MNEEKVLDEEMNLFIDSEIVARFGMFHAIFLAFMLEVEKDESEWLCLTDEEVKNYIGFSTYVQMDIIKDFERFGLIEIKVDELSGERYFRLNLKKLEEISKKK